MSRTYLWTWAVVVCLFSAPMVCAQSQPASEVSSGPASVAAVPRLIKFSGVVRDARGETLGSVAVRLTFAVYSEQQGGAALWAETQMAQLDEQGRYSVLLGAARADGLPVELFPAGKARWLGVQVEGRDEDARVLLVSVPYALKAEDAAMLGGRQASDFVLGEQLKEEVRTQVAAQTPSIATQAVEMLVSNPPNVPAIAEGPSTFTCATTGDCVAVTQSGTGRALRTTATSASEAVLVQQNGTGYGLRALSLGNVALLGQVTGSAGTSYGVKGQTTSTTGAGVFGYNLATTGLAYGILGQTASTSGTALFGRAVAATGATIGLRGHADSTSGTGIMGQATATSGATTGLVARVFSAAGTALIVDNTQGGKLLSGKVGSLEKFSVDGGGNVYATGVWTGSRGVLTVATGTPPLTVTSTTLVPNLNADMLDGIHASAFAPVVHAHTVGEVSGAARLVGGNSFFDGQSISSGDLSLASGNISLPETTSASAGVINLGGSPFIHAYGGNTFVGTNAGNFTTTGEVDTATGFMALNANTTGSWNTATGHQALQLNTAGSNNTATGGTALFSNTTGSENTATGSDALYYNTTGNFNTASAWRALHSNTTGYDNTASGVWALFSNTEGYRNTASGIWALYSNTTGNQNTADGTSALASNTTGNQNTASGWRALYSNTTGGNNTAVGRWSGYNNSTGSNNTFIGANAGPDSGHGDLTNATAIGAGAVVSQSNSLILGNGANVGIGTAAPAATLDVVGNIQSSGSVTASSFSGSGSAAGPILVVTQNGDGAGIVGTTNSTGQDSTGVSGYATGTTGLTHGVAGYTNSPDGNGVRGWAPHVGVYGHSTATSGQTMGVYGDNSSAEGAGVWGQTNTPGGTGVAGYSLASTGRSVGIIGATGSPDGVGGIFASPPSGHILEGLAGAGENRFTVDGNGNIWAYGSVTATSFVGPLSGIASDLECTGCVSPPEVSFNYAGSASQGGPATSALTATEASNALNLGSVAAANFARRDVSNSFLDSQSISGNSSDPILTVTQEGSGRAMEVSAHVAGDGTIRAFNPAAGGWALFGKAQGTGGKGIGGLATAPTGITHGVYGESESYSGIGVMGHASSTTGDTRGVMGTTVSPDGFGVYGKSEATTGATTGVRGEVYSTDDRSTAVFGEAFATTGPTFAVWGINQSTGGIAVAGDAHASTGANVGVHGTTHSPDGTAGWFYNVGGGTILRGRVGDPDTEVFRVEGSGNVWTSGSVTASSFVGALSGIASDLECSGCVAEADLGFNPATQTELDAEATSRTNADTTLQTNISGKVSKAGDTMTGTLDLPANGLIVGASQLVASSGGVGIGASGAPDKQLRVRRAGTEDTTSYGLYVTNETSQAAGSGSKHGAYVLNAGDVQTTSYGMIVTNSASNTTVDDIVKYGLSVSSYGTFTGSGGTPTRNYGLSVAPPEGADENYGAYIGGKVGIGTEYPKAQLQVENGDVYASTAGQGLIVKSPDGTKCARIGIDNAGVLAVVALACP